MADANASYFDGESAARRGVALRFEADGIGITGPDTDAFWRYADIRFAAPDATGLPVTFRSADDEQAGARLLIDDQATVELLEVHCHDLADRRGARRRRARTAAWSVAGVLAVALLALGTIHYLPRVIAPLIPATWEKALGDRVVEDIAALFGRLKTGSGKACDAAPGRLVLDRLTARLTAGVKLPYRLNVLVLDIGVVNALATPGGNIVVFRELLTEAKSPEEVAGVIAHEMGHVVARHPAQAVARDLGVSLIFNMLLGGFGGGVAGNIGETMLTSAYSRDAEREADAIGAKLLRDAGIPTAGFVAFFERLAKQAGSLEQAFSFISSHPPSAERAATARAKASQPSVASALTDSEWTALRAICGG